MLPIEVPKLAATEVGNPVQMVIESQPPMVPQAKAGTLRTIGAARRARSPRLPDVSTMTEARLKGFESGSWYGFHALAGTPKPIVDKLHADMAKIVTLSDVHQCFANVGGDTIPNSFTQMELSPRASSRDGSGSSNRLTSIKVD